MLKSTSKNIETVAIVEVDGSHDECILTQLSALKRAKKTIILICTQTLKDRNVQFDSLVDKFVIIDSSQKHKTVVKEICHSLNAEKVEKVVFNTAQGAKVRDICLKMLFSKIKFFGIIHTTRKFEGSSTQKIINFKIKNYFLLSEYLFKKVKQPRGIKLSYFYPIHFPNFGTEKMKSEKLTISIIGGVEKRRKDLVGFVKMVNDTKHLNVKYVFIGKSDSENEDVIALKKALSEKHIQDKVQLFEDYVSQEEFDRLLQQSDLILPIVHPDTPSADQYFKNQISGAVNVAFGYKIPLLIHEHYKNVTELKERSLYYNFDNFKLILEDAEGEIDVIQKLMLQDKELSKETQEKRYLDFVFSENN